MKEKYIELLLKRCINFDKSKSLFISFNPENIDFVKQIAFKANQMGVEDIYLSIEDPYITHDILKKIELKDIDNEPYFNWKKWDEYALKDSSFLILETEMPGLMDDIEPEKIARYDYVTRTTRPLYKKKQLDYVIPWCIAALPTENWANFVFPN